ncbi:MAG: FliA/WhiG family RNA polymerase sigma factor [Bdellovibrionales bacterium]|nr:FliA/WhiG family RNA polymerase sigma factor [Bdellovibrionales bacterium]
MAKRKRADFEYKKASQLTEEERKKLIEEYTVLIRFIAKRISIRLPANIDVEDLVSSGVIGLMDAIEKYDPTRDNKFKTYAEFRIRGSILDELRAQDWVPRSIRDKAKMLDRATSHLEAKLGRPPTDGELSEHLGLMINEFYNLVNQVRPVNMLSIDESSTFSNMDRKSFINVLQGDSDPFSYLNRKSVKNVIRQLIAELPERQRIVLSLYYYEGFNLKKIGTILGVTESRISQLHAQAIKRLKVKLQQKFQEHELKAA